MAVSVFLVVVLGSSKNLLGRSSWRKRSLVLRRSSRKRNELCGRNGVAKFWKRKPELLTMPNIPMPLHGVNPRTVLGGSWWKKEREEAIKSTNSHCEACGLHKTKVRGRKKWLEGHEVYHTDYLNGRLTYIRTTPLCPFCHQFIHDGRLRWLLDTRQITQERFVTIIQHGDAILKAAGLYRKPRYQREQELTRLYEQGLLAPWGEWRLVIWGDEYPPKYPTPEDYEKAKQS